MLTALDEATYGNEEAENELRHIRRLLTWILYHHQGAKSPIGQACRKTLGIGEFEQLTDEQILDAKKAIVDNRWQPIEKAPVDGTVIQARIPGNGSDNLIFWLDGLIDTDGNDCGGWAFTSDQEPPDCWTDGICWEVNEDGRKSIMPTHWKPYNAPHDGTSGASREGPLDAVVGHLR